MKKTAKLSARQQEWDFPRLFFAFVKGLLIWTIWLVPVNHTSAQSSQTSAMASVDFIFTRYNQTGMPGCAVGVVQKGELTTVRTYGLASVENNSPITAESRFDIGSMSKQFTAMSILMLEQQGKIKLSDDIRKYVPDLPSYGTPITLSNLIHQTSGLKDWDQLLTMAGWQSGDVRSIDNGFWIITRQHELNFAPGTQFRYSDTNYFLLGMVVERVTGKPFEDFLQENIFRPLGMTHTALYADRHVIVPNRAWPYAVTRGVPSLYLNSQESKGDGGIFTTIGDLALWELNLMDPKVGGPRIISKMQEPAVLASGEKSNYAAGFFLDSFRGQQMLEHNGAEFGYHAEKLTFPNAALSVILLCNRRDTNVYSLAEQVAGVFLPKDPNPRPNPSLTPSTEPIDLQSLAGPYWSQDKVDGFILTIENGGLVLDGSVRMRQMGPRKFLATNGMTYEFDESNGKRVAQAVAKDFYPDIFGQHHSFVYSHVQDPQMDEERLQTYAGEYVSSDLAAAWCVYKKGKVLMVRSRGSSERELEPIFKDAFFGPNGVVQFTVRDNVATGLSIGNDRLGYVNFAKLPPGQHPVPTPWSCP